MRLGPAPARQRELIAASRGTTWPGLGDCRPLDCADVALTPGNLTALRAERDRITGELAVRPGLLPLLQHRLRARRTPEPT